MASYLAGKIYFLIADIRMCDAGPSVLKSRLTVLKNDALVSYVLLGVNFNTYIVDTS
jgi:hypothetical protein